MSDIGEIYVEPATPRRILNVTPSAADHDAIACALTRLQANEVVAAASVEDALTALAGRGAFDVATIAHRLGSTSGTRLAARLIDRDPGLPVLLVFEPADAAEVATALTLGNVDYAIKDAGGTFLALLPGLVENLVRRRDRERRHTQTEAKLASNEKRLREVVASSPVCIHEIGLDGRLLSMNPAGLDMLGAASEGDVIGLSVLDYPVPADRPDVERLLDLARHGRASKFEYRTASGGGLRHFASSFVPIRDATGEVVRLMGITQDVTDARLAQIEVTRQHSLFRQTIDAAPIVITVKNRQHRFVYCNRYAAERWGLHPEAFIGRTVGEVLAGKDVDLEEAVIARDEAVFRSGDPIPFFEEALGGEARARRMLTSKSPIRNADGEVEYVVTIGIDITSQTRTERKLQQALAEAHRASEAKSHFLATMSHELRTPLNAIMGFSEVIAQELFGPIGIERYPAYARNIHDSGRHLLTLINDILDISAIESGQVVLRAEAIDLAAIAESCETAFGQPAQEKGVALSIQRPPQPALARGDARAIKQILYNLLSNAIKFTPAGGRVQLTVELTVDSVVLRVEDSGAGMTPAALRRVGEPFLRVNDNAYLAQDGAGLGLSIVKSLVDASGGSIDFRSRRGHGTVVVVKLPRADVVDRVAS